MSEEIKEVTQASKGADSEAERGAGTHAHRCAYCGLPHQNAECEHAKVFLADDDDIEKELRILVFLRGGIAYIKKAEMLFPEVRIRVEMDGDGVLITVDRPFLPMQKLSNRVGIPYEVFRTATSNPVVAGIDALLPGMLRSRG